jgi:hypothetical protein
VQGFFLVLTHLTEMMLVDVSGTVVEIVVNLERVYLKIDHIFLHTDLTVWTLLLEASVFSSTLYTSSWFHLHESVLH